MRSELPSDSVLFNYSVSHCASGNEFEEAFYFYLRTEENSIDICHEIQANSHMNFCDTSIRKQSAVPQISFTNDILPNLLNSVEISHTSLFDCQESYLRPLSVSHSNCEFSPKTEPLYERRKQSISNMMFNKDYIVTNEGEVVVQLITSIN